MSKNPETLFQNRAMKKLKALPRSWWMRVSVPYMAGVPDILGVVNGTAIGIELKVGKNKLSKIQEHVHMEMRSSGCIVYVCYPESFDSILTELKEISECPTNQTLREENFTHFWQKVK